MSEHDSTEKVGMLQRLMSLAHGLLPGASLVALEVVQGAAGGHGEAAGAVAGLLGTVGFATIGELFRSWHSLHLGEISSRRAAKHKQREDDDDRLFNHHLAAAVGQTIGDILRKLPDEAIPKWDRGAFDKIVASAPDAFKTATEAGLAPLELADAKLPGLIEAAATGKREPWGDVGMWAAILRVMADHVGVAPEHDSLLTAANACRDEFISRFFNTIKSDLEHHGAAFASIHLRMMGDLVVMARENAATTAKISQRQDETNSKLDQLLSLVNREGCQIVDVVARVNPGELPQIRDMALELSRLDGRLAAIGDHLHQISANVLQVQRGLVDVERTTRLTGHDTRAAIAREARQTRKWLVIGACGLLAVLLTAMYAIHRIDARRHEELVVLLNRA